MRIEKKSDSFYEITLKDSIRIPETDIILEKGDKIRIPNTEKLKESKVLKEMVAEFEVSLRDARKAIALVQDMRVPHMKGGSNVFIVDGEENYEELRDLFDSYNIEYDVEIGG